MSHKNEDGSLSASDSADENSRKWQSKHGSRDGVDAAELVSAAIPLQALGININGVLEVPANNDMNNISVTLAPDGDVLGMWDALKEKTAEIAGAMGQKNFEAVATKLEIPKELNPFDPASKNPEAEQNAAEAVGSNDEHKKAPVRKKSSRLGGLVQSAVLGAAFIGGSAGQGDARLPDVSHATAEASLNKRGKRSESTAGMTLIELTVSLSVIAVLAGMILPAVQAARESARNVQRANMMRQVGVASQNFESAHKHLPVGSRLQGKIAVPGIVDLLPFMEHQNLHNKWDFNKQPKDQSDEVQNASLSGYTFSDKPGSLAFALIANANEQYWPVTGHDDFNASTMTSSYTYGNQPMPQPAQATSPQFWNGRKQRIADITDGTSNTIIAAQKSDMSEMFPTSAGKVHHEADADGVLRRRWSELGVGHSTVPITPLGIGSADDSNWIATFLRPNSDTTRVHFLFGDGHVSSLPVDAVKNAEMDPVELLRRLARPADGKGQSGDLGL